MTEGFYEKLAEAYEDNPFAGQPEVEDFEPYGEEQPMTERRTTESSG